jgi:hypothetical protein
VENLIYHFALKNVILTSQMPEFGVPSTQGQL